MVWARPVSLLYFICYLLLRGRGGWRGGEDSKASVLDGLIFSVLSPGIMHGSWWKRCILVAGIYEWVQTGPQGRKPTRLLAKWLNCILLANLPSLSILPEITNTVSGSRSRSGRRHPPICKRINNWQVIENYYILTECFHFNLCSFSSLYSTSCPGNSQENHMRCKTLTWRHSASQMWILWRNKSSAQRMKC